MTVAINPSSAISKYVFLFALCVIRFLFCFPAQAQQQPTKIPRIGVLAGGSASSIAARLDAFRRGLHDLGYVEGKNVVIAYRYGDGKTDRLRALAAELIRVKTDVLVTTGSASTRAAKQTTTAVPIIMAIDDDPVGSGFAASLAKPGGNITGLSTLSPEIAGKKLELLKEIVPKLSRVAFIGDITRPGAAQALREMNLAADAFGIQLQYVEARTPSEIETAIRAANKEHADAMLLLASPTLNSYRKKIVDLAIKVQLPAIYPNLEFVDDGGLMAYAVNYTDLFRRAASYVDKVLKGARPADLAIEQPTKFELVINLKAAKQIGLTIPPNVLARADRVIK
jgi:putative ABC transport system substrate-binding protein